MNKYLKYSLYLFIIVGIIGLTVYFLALKSSNHSEMGHQTAVYTCPMHPEISRDKPGNCPICGMNLVKKVTENHTEKNHSIDNLLQSTDYFVVGKYQTTTAKDTALSVEINLSGIVDYNPNSAVNIVARISGRIEKMYVHYKYQKVNKGQKLFDIYSPELLTEQQNFIYLVSNDAENTSIIKASEQKLLLYGMTQNQVNTLLSTRKINPQISIYSPVSGIIAGIENRDNANNSSMQNINISADILNLKKGNYIKKGETVFKLLNTNQVWGIFNVSQGISSLIKINQPITITSELGKKSVSNAKINFVETQFDPTDKTNRIRVYLNNDKLNWPIGLRLQGIVKTDPVKGIWVQKQAMVSIGTQKVVFIQAGNGFKATAIQTGIETDDFVRVLRGLSIQDRIAQNAQYLTDSESFIKTK